MKKACGVVLGQINLDIGVDGFRDEMALVKESLVSAIHLHTGGDAQNAAVALASLGLSVRLSGRVGQDPAGEICLQRSSAAGVDISAVARVPGGQTGSCVALVKKGEASFLYTPGENERYCLGDIPPTLFEGAVFASLHSLYALPALDAAAVFEAAHAAGAFTFADTTNVRPESRIDSIGHLLPMLDVFAPSYTEAATLLQESEPKGIVQKLLALGTGCVLLKLGGEGCLVGDREGITQLPGHPSTVVDTTGAGDNFCAGFLYGRAQGYDNRLSAKYGNAAGAVAVSAFGPTGARQDAGTLQTMVKGLDS